MPTELQTDSRLLDRMRNSGRFVTREQLHRQRVSLIYGSLPQESTITRRQIEDVLAEHDGGATPA